MSISDLMQANLLDVFNERDPVRRRAVIDRIYASDVVFADPDEVVTGRAALDAKAQRLLDESPHFVFAADGPILVNHDLGHLAWKFGPEGQPPAVRGLDVALVQDDVITKVYTMLLTD